MSRHFNLPNEVTGGKNSYRSNSNTQHQQQQQQRYNNNMNMNMNNMNEMMTSTATATSATTSAVTPTMMTRVGRSTRSVKQQQQQQQQQQSFSGGRGEGGRGGEGRNGRGREEEEESAEVLKLDISTAAVIDAYEVDLDKFFQDSFIHSDAMFISINPKNVTSFTDNITHIYNNVWRLFESNHLDRELVFENSRIVKDETTVAILDAYNEFLDERNYDTTTCEESRNILPCIIKNRILIPRLVSQQQKEGGSGGNNRELSNKDIEFIQTLLVRVCTPLTFALWMELSPIKDSRFNNILDGNRVDYDRVDDINNLVDNVVTAIRAGYNMYDGGKNIKIVKAVEMINKAGLSAVVLKHVMRIICLEVKCRRVSHNAYEEFYEDNLYNTFDQWWMEYFEKKANNGHRDAYRRTSASGSNNFPIDSSVWAAVFNKFFDLQLDFISDEYIKAVFDDNNTADDYIKIAYLTCDDSDSNSTIGTFVRAITELVKLI